MDYLEFLQTTSDDGQQVISTVTDSLERYRAGESMNEAMPTVDRIVEDVETREPPSGDDWEQLQTHYANAWRHIQQGVERLHGCQDGDEPACHSAAEHFEPASLDLDQATRLADRIGERYG